MESELQQKLIFYSNEIIKQNNNYKDKRFPADATHDYPEIPYLQRANLQIEVLAQQIINEIRTTHAASHKSLIEYLQSLASQQRLAYL